MKKYVFLIVLLSSVGAMAQKALNNYKYVIIPTKYEFQKKADQYGVNTLLKYKFQQLGFETYLDTEQLPEQLMMNKCLSLTPVVNDKGGMFTTKTTVDVKDCHGEVLFTTQEGSSRSKSHEMAYKQALRSALSSFGVYRLNYAPKENAVASTVKIEKEQKTIPATLTVVNNTKFTFNNQLFLFVKEGINYSIKQQDDSIGVCVASTLKNNIYHVTFKNQKGIGYFLENGNFMVEIASNNTVQLLTLVKVN